MEDAFIAAATAAQAVADGLTADAAEVGGRAALTAYVAGMDAEGAADAGLEMAEKFDKGQDGTAIPGWRIDTWLSSLSFNEARRRQQ
eukprot:5918457-Prymnesium_polylepis.1